jgi:hypothetical protein
MKSTGAAALAVTAGLALAGCAARTVPRTTGTVQASVGARYKGTIETGGKKVRVRVDLYAARPDLLRAEIASPHGQTNASIVMRGEEVLIVWPRERAWWSGRTGGPALAGLPGGGAVWAAALLGDRSLLLAREGAKEEPSAMGVRVSLPIGGADGVSLDFPAEQGEAPLAIDSRPDGDLRIQLQRVSSLSPPDPAAAFPLDPPEGFAHWEEFFLPSFD